MNAGHDRVDYPLTTGQIVERVNATLAGGDAEQIEALRRELAGYNRLGVDLGEWLRR